MEKVFYFTMAGRGTRICKETRIICFTYETMQDLGNIYDQIPYLTFPRTFLVSHTYILVVSPSLCFLGDPRDIKWTRKHISNATSL